MPNPPPELDALRAELAQARAEISRLSAEVRQSRLEEEVTRSKIDVSPDLLHAFWQYRESDEYARIYADPQQLQLHLISALEGVLGSDRLAKWPADQKAIVRRVLETFGQIKPAAHIDPLAAAMGDRDPRQT